MRIQEGGVYILDENYAHEHNFFFKNSMVVAINSETKDGFFSGVQIGIFKNIKSDENRIFVEINFEGKKSLTVVSCEDVYMIPNSAVNRKIDTLDDITLKAIRYQIMINKEKTEKGSFDKIDYKKVKKEIKSSAEDLFEMLKNQKGNFVIINEEKFENIEKIEKILSDTNSLIVFFKNKIDADDDSKMKKILKKICLILSFIISFFSGVFASYCANHWDNAITKMINNIYSFIDYIRDMF